MATVALAGASVAGPAAARADAQRAAHAAPAPEVTVTAPSAFPARSTTPQPNATGAR
jgi:hypothetical protein